MKTLKKPLNWITLVLIALSACVPFYYRHVEDFDDEPASIGYWVFAESELTALFTLSITAWYLFVLLTRPDHRSSRALKIFVFLFLALAILLFFSVWPGLSDTTPVGAIPLAIALGTILAASVRFLTAKTHLSPQTVGHNAPQ